MKDLHGVGLDARLFFLGLGFVVLLELQSFDVFESSLHQVPSELLLALNHDVVGEFIHSLVVKDAARVIVEGSFYRKVLHFGSCAIFNQSRLFLLLEHGLHEMWAVH